MSEATAEVRETLSLSLRLRVARARATGDLFGKYSVLVRYLFGSFSEFVRSLPLVELDKRYDYAGGLFGLY